MKFSQYREVKQHGSPSFPVQYYFVDGAHPHYVMPLHWHTAFEIIRVRKGQLRLYLNNMLYCGHPGNVFFVSPSVLHRAEPEDCVYECAVFDMKLIAAYDISRISEYIQPIISSELEVEAICPIAEEDARELFSVLAEKAPYFELSAIALLYRIFHVLYSADCIHQTKKQSKAHIHRRTQMILLLEKLGKEYTEKISPKELADFCGIDEKYLFRVFKEFTGSTLTDYINSMRIDHAAYLMAVKGLSATEAAFSSGFNELSYFSRVFKRYKGISPGQYRRNATEK